MASKTLVIIGNWKMYKTPSEAKQFMQNFAQLYVTRRSQISPKTYFGFAVPAVDLHIVKAGAVTPTMLIAAQNVNAAPQGALTGELSLPMIKDAGANAVIIGHSERRAFFHEDDEMVNAKLIAALQAKVTPILCVGETLSENEAGQTERVLRKQMSAALAGVARDDYNKIIVAYEPVWAIGTGRTATARQAEAACAYIRKFVAPDTIIQYGGSVKPDNIAELMSQPNINGALVGGASLEAQSFVKLLTLNS